MYTFHSRLLTLIAALALLLPTTASPIRTAQTPHGPAEASHAEAMKALRSAPIMFIENVGQFADGARFLVRSGDHALWLADDALWVTILEHRQGDDPRSRQPFPSPPAQDDGPPRRGVHLKLSFVGANPHATVEPFGRLDTTVSYFVRGDPEQWHANVPAWGGVRYRDLYPGVDLEITGEGGRVAQRLVARPGADLSAVRLRVEGAQEVAVEADALRLATEVGDYRLPLLAVEGVESEPMIHAVDGGVYEVSRLYAQPMANLRSQFSTTQSSDLLYSTFLGKSSWDWKREGDIALDTTGSAYITGYTDSSDFPTTPGAFDQTHNGGRDAFVVKVNPSGSGLAYAAFLGGSLGDSGHDITVDGAGNAYVTGWTESSDFPTTPGAFDRTLSGYSNAFVVKVNPTGSGLAYATFLGGSSVDAGYGIAVDGTGSAYITGSTLSSDFPTTPGAFDETFNGGYLDADAYVVKLNTAGSGLAYATFLGGSSVDAGYGIAVDGAGSAYVTGSTRSTDFPTTTGAFDETFNGGYEDIFVVRLNWRTACGTHFPSTKIGTKQKRQASN